MASEGHVALVLAVSFLLAALSGEAYSAGSPSPSPYASKASIAQPPKSSIAEPPKSSIAEPPKSSIAQPPKSSIAQSPKASNYFAGAPSPSIATSPKASAPSPSPSSSPVSDISSSPNSAPPPYVESDLSDDDDAVDDYEDDTPSEVQKRQLSQDVVQKVTAVLNAKITAAMNQVENFSKDIIQKRLNDAATKEDTKKCLDLCKQVYRDAVADIKKAHSEVAQRDWDSAKVDVSAFSTDIETCQDCFVELEAQDAEIQKFEKSAQGIASDCLKALESI